jgi:hypothetical protein
MTKKDQDLTTEQAIQPTLGFLTQLDRRLAEHGLPPTDGYVRRVTAARDALHDLTVATHYLSLRHGVGRPDRS